MTEAYITDIVRAGHDFSKTFDQLAVYFRSTHLTCTVSELRALADDRFSVTFCAAPGAAAPANADTLRDLFDAAQKNAKLDANKKEPASAGASAPARR